MDKITARLGLQKGDWVGIITIVVLLCGIAAFIALAPRAEVQVYAPVEVTGSSLVVSEQQTGENTVKVSAELKRAGFIAVHQAMGEAPGPIVGQSPLLSVGNYADLVVATTEMLRPTEDYFVLLFVDDGDGVYELGVDLPVMSEGKVIKQKLSL